MDAKRIVRPIIEFLKGGELFLQRYTGQIPSQADDLHVVLQFLQPAGDCVEFSGGVGAVGRFDRTIFFAPVIQGALRDV